MLVRVLEAILLYGLNLTSLDSFERPLWQAQLIMATLVRGGQRSRYAGMEFCWVETVTECTKQTDSLARFADAKLLLLSGDKDGGRGCLSNPFPDSSIQWSSWATVPLQFCPYDVLGGKRHLASANAPLEPPFRRGLSRGCA